MRSVSGYGAGGYGDGDSGGNRSAVSADLASILPRSPLAEESANGDWEFEVQFMVELKPPKPADRRDADTASPNFASAANNTLEATR